MYLHYPVFLPVDWHFLNLKGETDKMRRLALAIALACILSGVIHAGEIPTTGATRSGEIHGTGVGAVQDSTTALTIILTLFSIVP